MNLEQMPWLISCDYVNFLEYHYPNVQTSGFWDEISNNVVERAFELISDSIAESNNAPSSEGLLSCLEYYLREIQDRLLEFSRFLDSILNLEISPYSDSRIPVERAVSLS
jgi:hypothetical protein